MKNSISRKYVKCLAENWGKSNNKLLQVVTLLHSTFLHIFYLMSIRDLILTLLEAQNFILRHKVKSQRNPERLFTIYCDLLC